MSRDFDFLKVFLVALSLHLSTGPEDGTAVY